MNRRGRGDAATHLSVPGRSFIIGSVIDPSCCVLALPIRLFPPMTEHSGDSMADSLLRDSSVGQLWLKGLQKLP